MASILIFHRRGFERLLNAVSLAWDGPVARSSGAIPDVNAAFVLILRDHPDAFRGVASRSFAEWPMAEILIVDSDWGLSARRTRTAEPSGWAVSEGEAIARLHAVAGGESDPSPAPWTQTYGERAAARADNTSGWPLTDATSGDVE